MNINEQLMTMIEETAAVAIRMYAAIDSGVPPNKAQAASLRGVEGPVANELLSRLMAIAVREKRTIDAIVNG